MSDLALPHNEGLKFRVLRQFARVARKYNPIGKERILRAIYPPDKRQNDHIEVTIKYDADLLININTASFIEWSIFFYGYYEPAISALIKRIVKMGQVAFDVGANIGCQTLIMARAVGETGQVIAVEPHPRICARLTENVCLNQLKNVTLLQCALSDAAGKFTLYVAPDELPNQGMSSFYPHSELSLEIPVETLTLDSVMQEKGYDRLDFVKIDVQGNDYQVLLGGERSIREHQPYLLFEYDEIEWGRSKVDFADCDNFFHKQQYILYALGATGSLTKLKYGLPSSTNILAVPPNSY